MNKRIFTSILLVLSCLPGLAVATSSLPITIGPGFDLYVNIAGAKPPKTVADVRQELHANWGKDFDTPVYDVDGKPKTTVGSCSEFFAAQKKGWAPAANVDYQPYVQVGLMCRAAQLIANAKLAKQSYLSNLAFDRNVARYLPASAAYYVNPSTSVPKGKTWAQVEKILSGTRKIPDKVELHSPASIHLVTRIATGDFNGDGSEDWLLYIVHGATQGTNTTQALFVVTRFKDRGPLKILNIYAGFEGNTAAGVGPNLRAYNKMLESE